jgi:ribA/ribD-fused uncharacterized protein
MKFAHTSPMAAKAILNTVSPLEAIRVSMANKDKVRHDWKGDVRIAIMRNGLDHKFTQNSTLAKKLIESDGCQLICGLVHDSFWGEGMDGKGENMTGKLLMELRRDLIESKE